MQKSALTSRERLERQGQASSAAGGRNKHRIDNVIVIGTSAGGHLALAEIFKDLFVDMPAVIVIVLHLPRTRSLKLT
jgi:chemotaxis response regulator CheB